MLNSVEEKILDTIDNVKDLFSGAHNVRSNGKAISRSISKNIDIINKEDKPGINVVIKPNTIGESVHVPVILSDENFKDLVYNTFDVGEGSDVVVVAGCGIHNCGTKTTQHDGIHDFIVRKGAHLKYVEKHYAGGDGEAQKIFNTKTILEVEEDGVLEMELIQIKGVTSTKKDTEIRLHKNAHLIITERIFTELDQEAQSHINIELVGEDSTAQVISRSVSKDNSKQLFYFNMKGENKCRGHIECDSIIMGNAQVTSVPSLSAYNEDAELIHEAAIGKIASDQLMKLMSLGLTEKEAEETILKGFLK
ncbi:FeS cluster assembly protein SufB [Clostridium acetireducens DSM 10703]|jgi:Fe-S cluster assembly scaffold protein SufB|uniref:FeS cluster assembly protein SufB n=1 Tax=Clostridium acetireducens DSM 10703 TaxID=1121290 RepID=A0A1E8EUC7_9CLOT|nr:SufD family Fe-S cluster assembly protein [Clostridium acetireducens]OFH96837.1 FeS cluster assembly protein SufB [Clostridium acetireducens DSM 10703]